MDSNSGTFYKKQVNFKIGWKDPVSPQLEKYKTPLMIKPILPLMQGIMD